MKKVLACLLAMVLAFSFVACGKSKSDDSEDENNSVVEEQKGAKGEDKDPYKGMEIVGSDVVTIPDVCEFNIDYTDITTDVMPPKPDNYYTHYEAEDGKVYVDVCVAYKNIATENIGADDTMKGKLIYGDKYEFTGFTIIEEDNRGDFTYSNITSISPLSTEYVHYLFKVPSDVKTSEYAVKVVLTISDKDYLVIVRDGEGAPKEETTNKKKDDSSKSGGNVTAQQTVTTDNCEFFVDYSSVTTDVKPPKPDDYYTHYEADDGKAYVDLCIGYKNTSSSNVGADDVIKAQLKYADKYEFKGFSIIEEDSRGDFTYSNITSIAPLSTEYVHYLFEVPTDVKNSSDSLVVSFTIDGNDYTYNVR